MRINAAWAAFEEARTGVATEIESDRKAMRIAACKHIVDSARSYGAMFKAHGGDSEVAKKILRAVTQGVGSITAESTEEETRDALNKSIAIFLFEGEDMLCFLGSSYILGFV